MDNLILWASEVLIKLWHPRRVCCNFRDLQSNANKFFRIVCTLENMTFFWTQSTSTVIIYSSKCMWNSQKFCGNWKYASATHANGDRHAFNFCFYYLWLSTLKSSSKAKISWKHACEPIKGYNEGPANNACTTQYFWHF